MTKVNVFEDFYRRGYKKVPWANFRIDSELASIIKSLKLPTSAKVLDLGCGIGNNSRLLSRYGFKIFGIDISRKAISLAQIMAKAATFVTGDVTRKLPYDDKCFDLVIDIGLFHCIPRNKRIFLRNEIFRVLKPGGYYYMNQHLLPPGSSLQKPKHKKGRFIIWFFNFSLIRKIFAKKFLIVEKWKGCRRISALMLKKNRK